MSPQLNQVSPLYHKIPNWLLTLFDFPQIQKKKTGCTDLRVELEEKKVTRIEVKTTTTVGENEPEVVCVWPLYRSNRSKGGVINHAH